MTSSEDMLLDMSLNAAELLGVRHGERKTLRNPYANGHEAESAEATVQRQKLSEAYRRGYRRARQRVYRQKRKAK